MVRLSTDVLSSPTLQREECMLMMDESDDKNQDNGAIGEDGVNRGGQLQRYSEDIVNLISSDIEFDNGMADEDSAGPQKSRYFGAVSTPL